MKEFVTQKTITEPLLTRLIYASINSLMIVLELFSMSFPYLLILRMNKYKIDLSTLFKGSDGHAYVGMTAIGFLVLHVSGSTKLMSVA